MNEKVYIEVKDGPMMGEIGFIHAYHWEAGTAFAIVVLYESIHVLYLHQLEVVRKAHK